MDVKIWAQMFFDDGSVSEGKRFPIEMTDTIEGIGEISQGLLSSTNRTEGFLLLWGAGEIRFYNITSSSEVSDSSASVPCLDLSPEHTTPQSSSSG